MRRLVLLISFIIYWVLMISNAFIDENGFAILMFYIALFMPLTIAILIEKDVFALFIILLYEVAELLMSLMYVASSFAEIEDASIILIITEFITALYAFSILSEEMKILRNKDNKIIWYIIGLGGLRCIFTIINFIIAKDFSAEMIISMISNMIFIFAISLYVVCFGKKEIKIFIRNE